MNMPIPTRSGIVLLVDNAGSFLEASANRLKQSGYTVFTARSAWDVLAILVQRWVHLVIIDTRLHDDEDPVDFSGLRLALDERLSAFQRIVYTAYTTETIEQLFAQHFGALPPGLRIYSKREHDIADIVDRAFRLSADGGSGQVGINFRQKLVYTDRISILVLVGLFRPVPTDGEIILSWIGEIEDLFGKAFVECDTLLLALLAYGTSQSVALMVTPQQDHQPPQAPMLVRCGDRRTILTEYRNYQDHVRHFMYWVARLQDPPVETLSFGLLTYRIMNGSIDETLPFAEFYRWNTSTVIEQVIRHLFREVMLPWHQHDALRFQKGYLCRAYEERFLFPLRGNIALPELWKRAGDAVRQVITSSLSLPALAIDDRGNYLCWHFNDDSLDLPEPYQFLSALRVGQRPARPFPQAAPVLPSEQSERQQLILLRQLLLERFNDSELRMLCSDLDIEYDDLAGGERASKARELIEYLQRRQRLPELITMGRHLRPDVNWPQVMVAAARTDADTNATGNLFPASYVEARGHGALHSDHIRVANDARAWLINFERTGWGPLLQDAIELESSIHFKLLQERQMERRLWFEKALADQEDLDQPLDLPAELGDSPDFRKAFAAILAIRREASRIEGARYADYLLGLIYQALRVIVSDPPPLWIDLRRHHTYKIQALFMASVNCWRLAALDHGLAAGGEPGEAQT